MKEKYLRKFTDQMKGSKKLGPDELISMNVRFWGGISFLEKVYVYVYVCVCVRVWLSSSFSFKHVW